MVSFCMASRKHSAFIHLKVIPNVHKVQCSKQDNNSQRYFSHIAVILNEIFEIFSTGRVNIRLKSLL